MRAVYLSDDLRVTLLHGRWLMVGKEAESGLFTLLYMLCAVAFWAQICCPAACAAAHSRHWYQAQSIYQQCAIAAGATQGRTYCYKLECTC